MALLQDISQRTQQELQELRHSGSLYRRFSEGILEPAGSFGKKSALLSSARRPSVSAGAGYRGAALTASCRDSCDVELHPLSTTAASYNVDAQTLYAFFVGHLLQARIWRKDDLGLFAALQRRAQPLIDEVIFLVRIRARTCGVS